LPLLVVALTLSPLSLEVNVTVALVTGEPLSDTVAVAVEIDVPFAGIDIGANATLTVGAKTAVCVNIAVPDTLGETELSVAVIVAVPAVVELVIVAV